MKTIFNKSLCINTLAILPLMLAMTSAGAQCPNDNTNPFSTEVTLNNTGDSQVLNCLWGGDYIILNTESGGNYTIETCTQAGFDTEITLYDDTGGGAIDYNDDYCGAQSQIDYTAGFTGRLRVLIDQAPSCGTNSVCQEMVITFNSLAPVELMDFRAQTENGTVVLDWQTASESNSRAFVVERSTDAKRFTAIGEVPAAGTTSDITSYGYIDRETTPGTSYYRLRQEDLDGKKHYSAVVEVSLDAGQPGLSVFPAPLRGQSVTVAFEAPEGGSGTLVLRDITGKPVLLRQLSVTAGLNRLTLPTADLAQGYYLLQLEAPGLKVGRKVLK